MSPRPLQQSRPLLDTALVVIAKVAAGASILAINLFAVRHLPPAVYGVLAFCLTNLQLCDALIGSAFDMTVLKLGGRETRQKGLLPIEKSALTLKLLLGVLLLVLFATRGEWLGQQVFHSTGGQSVFLALGFAVVALLIFRSFQTHFQLNLEFRRYSVLDLGQAGLRLALLLGLISFGVNSPSVLVAWYGLASVLAAGAFTPAIFQGQAAGGWIDKEKLLHVFRDSGRLAAIAGFSLTVFNLDMFVLAIRQGPGAVGILRAGYTIALIPELLGMYLGQALAPRIVPLRQHGKFAPFYKYFQLRAVAAAAILLILALGLVGPVGEMVFPPAYREALPVVRILLPATVASLASWPLTMNYMIFVRPTAFFIVDLLLAPFMLAGYWLTTSSLDVVAVAQITTAARLIKIVAIQIWMLLILRGEGTSHPEVADASA